MNGKLTSGVDTIIRIKNGVGWKDAVGKSYDGWLEQLGYLAGQADLIYEKIESLAAEIRSVPVAELEDEYDRLTRLFAEVGF